MFGKNESLELSKKFFELLESKLEKFNPTISGFYNLFGNCDYQGLQLIIFAENDNDEDLCIWCCMHESSRRIMVVIADRSYSDNHMFIDKALYNAKYFNEGECDKATEYALNVIKRNFPNNLDANYKFKFCCNKNLADLERIITSAEDFDYNEYRELATLEIGNFCCDLIIQDGQAGLRYSKFVYDNCTELENIHFEKFDPDLTNDETLMLCMKQKLNDFIDAELDYNISIEDGSIKI